MSLDIANPFAVPKPAGGLTLQYHFQAYAGSDANSKCIKLESFSGTGQNFYVSSTDLLSVDQSLLLAEVKVGTIVALARFRNTSNNVTLKVTAVVNANHYVVDVLTQVGPTFKVNDKISVTLSAVGVLNGTDGTNGLPGSNGGNGSPGVDGTNGTNGTDGLPGGVRVLGHLDQGFATGNGAVSLHQSGSDITNPSLVDLVMVPGADEYGNSINSLLSQIEVGDFIGVYDRHDANAFGIYEVNSINNSSTWVQFNVSVLAYGTNFTTFNPVFFTFTKNGTNGSNGTNGVDGANGTSDVPGADGTNGTDGTSGSNGAPGLPGAPTALMHWDFSEINTGAICINDLTDAPTTQFSSVSTVNVSVYDEHSNYIANFLASVLPGDFIRVFDRADPTVFGVYPVVSGSNEGSFYQFAVGTPLFYGNNLTTGADNACFTFAKNGQNGTDGTAGANGTDGTNGTSPTQYTGTSTMVSGTVDINPGTNGLRFSYSWQGFGLGSSGDIFDVIICNDHGNGTYSLYAMTPGVGGLNAANNFTFNWALM